MTQFYSTPSARSSDVVTWCSDLHVVWEIAHCVEIILMRCIINLLDTALISPIVVILVND